MKMQAQENAAHRTNGRVVLPLADNKDHAHTNTITTEE
jgi:hypothetical protein